MNSDPGSQFFGGPGRRALATLAALLIVAVAQAQTPAPADSASPAAGQPPPKPRPPLKLRLDDADLRSLTPPAPADKEKKQDANGLPALGGNPSPTLERKASDVVPKDLTPGL
jgi:hypothetical protein